MEYVQIPIEKNEKPSSILEKVIEEHKEKEEKQESSTDLGKKAVLVKQISSTNTIDSEDTLVRSGSESSISEACDSIKESSKRFETEKDQCSDNEATVENKNLNVENKPQQRKPSLVSAKSLHELKDEYTKKSNIDECVSGSSTSKSIEDDCGNKLKGIRPSKSDTSLTDSFVVVDNEYSGNKRFNNQNTLREGKREI